jgi:hypothetical protein
MSHLEEEIMNFKKITTIIEGNLKRELEKNTGLRYSLGMYSACNFAGRILSWNFMPAQELSRSHGDNDIFLTGSHGNRVFENAFNRCSRINVELFMVYADFISIRASFYESSEKEKILTVDALVMVSDGSVSVTGMSASNKL